MNTTAKIAHQKNNLDVVSFGYEHDSNGNRSQMNVTSPIAQALAQVNYTYDQVNQLTGATKNVSTNADETFTYDNLGNRLKKNGQAVSNVYDNNNRIVEDDKFTYAHDDSGNLIKKVNKQSGYTHKYVWDYENKLQFVTEHLTENSGTLKTHTYIYDVLGRRIMKDSNGVIRKYVYDNEDILLEFDNNDSLQAKFTHGPGIDEPVEMLKGSQKYFYHTDGLGSITALTDGSGNAVQSYSYNSFGETKVFNGSGVEINPSSMIQSPYGYTGREWDLETSQYYYRARYYNPSNARFLSEDPAKFSGGDTNLYRYVFNSPVNYNDPSGLLANGTINAGEEYGEYAVYYWVKESENSCSSSYKMYATFMGHLASLWTNETSDETLLTLLGAYEARVLGPFSQKGVPKVIQRQRKYLRFDPPQHRKGWEFDGVIPKAIRKYLKGK